MKTSFTFIVLFFSAFSFGQTERHSIKLDIPDGYEQIKTTVKDYGNSQLIGGTISTFDSDLNTLFPFFWFAKMQGDSLLWAKTFPTHPQLAPMDISQTDIVRCNGNGDIIFIGRGNLGGDYTTRVIKTDTDGNLLWSHEIVAEPNTYSQTVYENNPMIVENDGVIISMAGENHLQVTKLSLTDGSIVYSKQLRVAGSGVSPGHLFIQDGGDGYIAGFECDSYPTLVHLDHSLNVLWTQKIVTAESAKLRSLHLTTTGKLYAGGIGESEGETFLTQLNSNGDILNYRSFNNTEGYSIDQIFELNDTTIIAADRFGYVLLNTNDWSYEGILYENLGFCAFNRTFTGFSFGSHWNRDYYLHFNPLAPECFDYTGPIHDTTTNVSASPGAVTCAITDVGTLNNYSAELTSVAATLSSGCDLSVKEKMPNSLTIYPNPVRSEGELSFSMNSGTINKNGRIIFTDLQGTVVMERAFESTIALPTLSAGIYFVRILDEKGNAVAVQRVVLE